MVEVVEIEVVVEDDEGADDRGGWRRREVIRSRRERLDAADLKVEGVTVSAKRKMPMLIGYLHRCQWQGMKRRCRQKEEHSPLFPEPGGAAVVPALLVLGRPISGPLLLFVGRAGLSMTDYTVPIQGYKS